MHKKTSSIVFKALIVNAAQPHKMPYGLLLQKLYQLKSLKALTWMGSAQSVSANVLLSSPL